ncbi:hypothetical protein ACFX11_025533 [Malus domestica]
MVWKYHFKNGCCSCMKWKGWMLVYMVMTSLWAIWKERNSLLWEGRRDSPVEAMAKVSSWYHEFRQAWCSAALLLDVRSSSGV